MGGFLYFIPDQVTRVAELAAWGLDYAFEREAGEFTVVGARGPSAAQGTIVADARAVKRVGYYPAEQDWRRIVPPMGETPIAEGHGTDSGRENCWLGLAKADPPGPEDLIRRDALAGLGVRLLDGREWIVPVARGLNEEDGELRYRMNLPTRITLDEGGRWASGEVTPRWKRLWEVAERFWNAFLLGGAESVENGLAVSMRFGDIAEAAVTALGANYRLRRDEAAILALLDEANALEICQVLVDWGTMETFLKKKAQEHSASTPGG